MMQRCAQPDRQSEILEAMRAGWALEPGLARHASACAACRVAVERLRRMVEVWQGDRAADAASDREAALCAARLARKSGRTQPARERGVLSFAAIGAVAGAAFFLALHGPSSSSSSSPSSSPSSSTAMAPGLSGNQAPVSARGDTPSAQPGAAAAAGAAVPHVEGPHGVIKLAEGLRVDLAAGESAEVTLAGGATSELHGPCRVEFWSSSSEVGGWRMSFFPAASAAMSLPAPAVARAEAREPKAAVTHPKLAHPHEGQSAAPNPELDRAWQRASDALRRDDVGAADHALADLEKATDPATRDAARLTRAQLAMAHGQGESARAALEDLRDNGATPLVRQRAAECLGRLNH